MNKDDLIRLSRARLREAQALLKAGHPDGACYLAGYSVECMLKACVAKGTRAEDFPDKKRVNDSWTHNLANLVRVAGLEKRLQEEQARDQRFALYWKTVVAWSEDRRYVLRDKAAKFEARELIKAVSDSKHGVLKWLSRFC